MKKLLIEEMREKIGRILYLLIPLYAIYRAARNSWVCDDAFISFRYALNFSRGLGLVFNAGERVEGYTNFLWTVILSPFIALGLDPVMSSIVLGIVCFCGLLFFLFQYGGQLALPVSVRSSRYVWIWSLPAVALHEHLQRYATSGLETMFFTFLVTTGSLLVISSMNRENEKRSGLAGFSLLVLACLTRPDGLLIYGIASIFAFISQVIVVLRSGLSNEIFARLKSILKITFKFHKLFLFGYIPYWILRYLYYGLPFPNTFYAKSAYESYYSQGFFYFWLYIKSYWIFLLLPLLIGIRFFFAMRRKAERPDLSECYALTLVLVWILYVIYVGGDFMFSRFFLPVTPLLILLFERSLRHVAAAFSIDLAHLRYLAIVPALLVFLRVDYFSQGSPILNGVSEEFRIYSLAGMKEPIEIAKSLRPALRETKAVVGFVGAQAFLVYYMDPVTAIECETGLTDRRIASRVLSERGRVGHEKTAPYEYLLERNVSFLMKPPPPERNFGFNVMRIDGFLGDFEIVRYIPQVMDVLGKDPRIHFLKASELRLQGREKPGQYWAK